MSFLRIGLRHANSSQWHANSNQFLFFRFSRLPHLTLTDGLVGTTGCNLIVTIYALFDLDLASLKVGLSKPICHCIRNILFSFNARTKFHLQEKKKCNDEITVNYIT